MVKEALKLAVAIAVAFAIYDYAVKPALNYVMGKVK